MGLAPGARLIPGVATKARKTREQGHYSSFEQQERRRKTPTTLCDGRKPGTRCESERRRKNRRDQIPESCHVSTQTQTCCEPLPRRVCAPSGACFYPHKSPKSVFMFSSACWRARSSIAG